MMTRDFGMGFFGRMPFGTDERKDFFGKWFTMTDEEKIEFMNKRMEFMNNGEHGCFSGKREFSVADMDKRCEEWLKKTPEEKKAFLEGREEAMEHFRSHIHSFGRGRGFGFGGDHRENWMNDLRDKWSNMSDEEKKEFIRAHEDKMKNHAGFFERCSTGSREA